MAGDALEVGWRGAPGARALNYLMNGLGLLFFIKFLFLISFPLSYYMNFLVRYSLKRFSLNSVQRELFRPSNPKILRSESYRSKTDEIHRFGQDANNE